MGKGFLGDINHKRLLWILGWKKKIKWIWMDSTFSMLGFRKSCTSLSHLLSLFFLGSLDAGYTQHNFFFAIKQLKPLVYLSLFTSDKICSDMRVEVIPFCLLTFHFRASDTTRIKATAETPQTTSNNIPLSAHNNTEDRDKDRQWRCTERCVAFIAIWKRLGV